MYKNVIKRVIDSIFSLTAIFLLLPVFAILVILLSISHNGTPFFIQSRPGKNNKIFLLIKFRSMNNKCDAEGTLLPDINRITQIGHFIRSTSLDELPQLINVLKGDMSLVGPRPLLVKYLPLYTPVQARRHEVRPGMTGWTQVTGRNNLSWEEKFKRDVWYVDNMCFILDMKILWLTLIRVIKRDGINQQGHVTMSPFLGKGTNYSPPQGIS